MFCFSLFTLGVFPPATTPPTRLELTTILYANKIHNKKNELYATPTIATQPPPSRHKSWSHESGKLGRGKLFNVNCFVAVSSLYLTRCLSIVTVAVIMVPSLPLNGPGILWIWRTKKNRGKIRQFCTSNLIRFRFP